MCRFITANMLQDLIIAETLSGAGSAVTFTLTKMSLNLCACSLAVKLWWCITVLITLSLRAFQTHGWCFHPIVIQTATCGNVRKKLKSAVFLCI